ncbi:MAG: TetR/AcrR family transcriptional regulator [Mariprofundaceae bacterium]
MHKPEKEIIVAAAKRRFAHYGYGKTTMAEIADDCQMSVGNLYRFYKNKEDIAVEGARTCLDDKAKAAEYAAGQADVAIESLRNYFVVRLRYLHGFMSETPHMHELVQLIVIKHRDMLQQFEDRARETIRHVITLGINRGEFRTCDTATIAADLYNATSKYNMPICMDMPLEILEAELESLMNLLYEGIQVRKSKSGEKE